MRITDYMCLVIVAGLCVGASFLCRADTTEAQLRQQQLHELRTQMVDDARGNRPELQQFVDWFPWAVGVTDSGIIYGEAWHGTANNGKHGR